MAKAHPLAYLAAILVAAAAPLCAYAQEGEPRMLDLPVQYYKGYRWTVDEAGDSVIVYYLTDLYVFPKLKFKNAKERQAYDRLARNVRLTLPYAKMIAETLVETYEYIETLPEKEREPYLKRMERDVFEQYKPVLKRFSKTQAKVLIKLIQRETHQSSYDILRAFLGTGRAAFWQGFGRLCGVNLRAGYRPDDNAEDSRIEAIASRLELGLL